MGTFNVAANRKLDNVSVLIWTKFSNYNRNICSISVSNVYIESTPVNRQRT